MMQRRDATQPASNTTTAKLHKLFSPPLALAHPLVELAHVKSVTRPLLGHNHNQNRDTIKSTREGETGVGVDI